MPRPGPRPYECVRRAWHSDRHQPIRGSIIQQVFRLVNETHSSRTKKNREWQEKLPIVVLKAEEIMYSKANSEAEYMDLETLWERMNDAINVIIRKDDTVETGGELLQPCIEAALILGCVPVRASRSQRHGNPRTYLTPTAEEPTSIPLRAFENAATERRAQLSLCPTGNVFGRSTPTNCHLSNPVTDRHVAQDGVPNGSRGFPFLYENLPPHANQAMVMETNTPLKLGSVYPLYYGTHYQSEESLSGFCTSQHENDNNKIFVGTPVGTSVVEPSNKIVLQLQNLFTSDNKMERTLNSHNRAPEIMCDLSLQLGFSSNILMKNPGLETIDTGGKFKNKEICLFPPSKAGFDAVGSCSSKWISDDVIGLNMDATPARKRKIPISENMDQFTKWPGM